MTVQALTIQDLRAIRELTLAPAPGINVISGDNGAGKTSVLEAVYLAGRGRSFRHSEAKPLIREGAEETRVIAKIAGPLGHLTTLGLSRDRRHLRCRRDGQEVKKRSVLAETLPIQWVSSQPQLLLELGPELRRRFLDMVVFHVKHDYLLALSTYQRVLKQRNAALRTGHGPSARAWDDPLAEAAQLVDSERQQILQRVVEKVGPLITEWPIGYAIRFRYQRGWSLDNDLPGLLATRIEDDLRQGYTGRGPHRAELEVVTTSGGREHPASKVLSRGQLKLLVIALNLAVFDVISEAKGRMQPVWLLDDLAAELDLGNRARVIAALHDRSCQALITRLSDESLPEQSIDAMFHVEHGRLI